MVWRERTRGKAEAVWTHVLRKDAGYIRRRMVTMEMPGKRKQGRPVRSFMYAAREDLTTVEVTQEDAEERT